MIKISAPGTWKWNRMKIIHWSHECNDMQPEYKSISKCCKNAKQYTLTNILPHCWESVHPFLSVRSCYDKYINIDFDIHGSLKVCKQLKELISTQIWTNIPFKKIIYYNRLLATNFPVYSHRSNVLLFTLVTFPIITIQTNY